MRCPIMIGKPILKNCTKVNLYPCCSATPAHTTFALAPIRVPLPGMMKMVRKFTNYGKVGAAAKRLLAALHVAGSSSRSVRKNKIKIRVVFSKNKPVKLYRPV